MELHENHVWLAQLVGDWRYEVEMTGEPGQQQQKFHARETVRSVGGLWVVGEAEGDTPEGGKAQMVITLGYDPQQNHFCGTFIASMAPNLWLYSGELDKARRVLTLNTEGPDMTDPAKIVKYQDIIELVNADERIMRSQALGDDGKWHPVMTAKYTRISAKKATAS